MTSAPTRQPTPTLPTEQPEPTRRPVGPTTASTRTTAVQVGLLFLTATAAFIGANAEPVQRRDSGAGQQDA